MGRVNGISESETQNIRYASDHLLVKDNVHCVQSASRESRKTSYYSITKMS